MPMGYTPQRERVLEGSVVFGLWLKHGTIVKVRDILSGNNTFSPRTGRPFTIAGLTLSAWRYALRNPEESYIRIRDSRASIGLKLTREQWNVELVKHGRTSLTPTGYMKFLETNGLEEFARSV